jgi:hypothetical protein
VVAAGAPQASAAEVTAVGEKGVATVTTKQAGQTLTDELSADDKGVYRHSSGGQKLDAPVTILRYPVAVGAKWSGRVKFGGQEVPVEFEAKKPEKVKVKAGEYTVYPVEMIVKVSGQTVTATNWYADGVGLVKQEMTLGAVTNTLELTKFTPAGQ